LSSLTSLLNLTPEQLHPQLLLLKILFQLLGLVREIIPDRDPRSSLSFLGNTYSSNTFERFFVT
jgi:hypothetical protein